jgi:hypothetical protein
MTGPTHTQYWVGPAPPGPPRIDATADGDAPTHALVRHINRGFDWRFAQKAIDSMELHL